jgi:proteasome lid subunit RPN8/RPN11
VRFLALSAAEQGNLYTVFSEDMSEDKAMPSSSPAPVEEIWLYENSFNFMIAASIETYPKECAGLLLGYRSWSHLDKIRRAIIEQAYPFQMPKRTTSTVEIPAKGDARCKEAIYQLSQLEPLGYFHSHPNAEPVPSKSDRKSMEQYEIELIVAIRRKSRVTPWAYNDAARRLTGTLGDYRFEISAYQLVRKSTSGVERIHILCPYALGVGSKYFDTQAKPPE